MSIFTLAEVKSIDGFEVTRGVSNFSELRPIFINDTDNEIAFKIQNGPIQESGVNGCQVDTIIETSKLILEWFNSVVPCRENSMAITKLDEALMWIKKRKSDRIARGVEGKSAL